MSRSSQFSHPLPESACSPLSGLFNLSPTKKHSLNRGWAGVLIASFPAVTGSFPAQAADSVESIRVIRALGREGEGNPAAAEAGRNLAAGGPETLPVILAAMDGAGDLSLNWLRAAAETIVDRALAQKLPLPVADLGKFLLDTHHNPRARRFSFELIARVDPSTASRLSAGMIQDPSPELRFDAVQKLIDQATRAATEGNKAGARLLFQQSLQFALDVTQIDLIVKKLRESGEAVDLPYVLGFVRQWKVVGPFDSVGGKGFAAAYPPEEKIDLSAEYQGKTAPVKWRDWTVKDDYGSLSMNEPFGSLKGVAAYAWSEFEVSQAQDVELRLGSENAWKVWVNGQFIFGQEEYHRNKAIDQYRMPVHLNAGRNVILVKVCQNEQTEDWAGAWDFQLRVCDPSGAALHSVGDKPSPTLGDTKAKP